MFLNGELDETIDYAVFADTQEEPESVYAHLDWLRSLGGPPILTATAGKLGDDLIHGKNSTGQRFASIPAFTSATPGVTGGMLRRQCTAEYKKPFHNPQPPSPSFSIRPAQIRLAANS